MALGERKRALIARARALDKKARSLTHDRYEWANGFKELKREMNYLFRDMASLNDDLKARNFVEIAPTTFVQEVVRIILLVANKQISVEQARLQSIALTLTPDALRGASTNGDSETSGVIPSQIKAGVPAQAGTNTRMREEAEEEPQMQELQKTIKEEQTDPKTSYRTPGPMLTKYVDNENEVEESKEPTIQGPSLVACERCIERGKQCLAYNTTRRSVCSNSHAKRVRCSNSRKSMKEAAMAKSKLNGDPQPDAKPQLGRTVGPRRQALSRRVEELEQVIEELKAEVVKRQRNDQLEDAILTMSNFIQQHTASLDARVQGEQATAQRVRALEATLLVSGIPVPPPVPEAAVASTNDGPISFKSISSLPSTSRDGILLTPHHGRKRVGSEIFRIPKRARSV
ncbi:hypothetical protein M413DRAFT_29746 [Hebeloma cylindrosporum]|uniref:Uncharacterized protein n=1 Tax=Hebeloma cylindrosporum TaxID=76867 RepID=A0A0C3C5C7_HEBCY|nr:hypothetical protein M413DRAFT_29746 [Hebeloma cylindrosporum h7]